MASNVRVVPICHSHFFIYIDFRFVRIIPVGVECEKSSTNRTDVHGTVAIRRRIHRVLQLLIVGRAMGHRQKRWTLGF